MELNLETLSRSELLALLEKELSAKKDYQKEIAERDKKLQLQDRAIQLQDKKLHLQDKIIQKKDEQLAKTENQVVAEQYEVMRLNSIIAKLRRMLFGSKRERFIGDSGQGVLPFEEYATEEEKKDDTPIKEVITYEREKQSKKHPGRNSIPDDLPTVEIVIEPTEDTTGLKKIGEECTEILEVTPAKMIKVKIIRPKYVRVKEDEKEVEKCEVLIGNLPVRPIDKCLAGTRLLAMIIIQKYIDHLPLYRQQQIFRRFDIEIASSTIDSWVAQIGKLLDPLYEALLKAVKAQTYLQADETTIKVLDKLKKEKTHLGYFWAYHSPVAKLAVFLYCTGRSIKDAELFLKDYKGALQTDGFGVYKHFYVDSENTHLACWVHVRRKFEEALSKNQKLSAHVLTEIQKLYKIEEEVKNLSVEQRKEIRLEKALPIINELGKWLSVQRPKHLPKSDFRKAIEYATNLWPSLLNYLNDGNFKMDNNLIENKIRPIAIGRKNYLFAGSHEGAKRSAMMYSFFACCSLDDINPQKWLEYVLDNIKNYQLNTVHELLPHNINKDLVNNYKLFYEV